MRILILNPRKKLNQNPGHQYTFYEVLQVLYKLIDDESQFDKGKILQKMNKIKKSIIELAVNLGNLALLNDWFNLKGVKKLPKLAKLDKKTGFYKADNKRINK